MDGRRRYFQYSLSPSKPIPSRSLRRYKIHVGDADPPLPESDDSSSQVVDTPPPLVFRVREQETESITSDSLQDDSDDSDVEDLTSSSNLTDVEENEEISEENEDIREEEDVQSFSSQALYDGSEISTTTSNILIMTYAKKFNLTQDAFKALIELIRVHCPKENKCVSSVFKLKSFF
ncbi:hypothetical protein OS493_018475 [Desmophyllum pertusum]|uniref:Uncharacterized protein n=1 Tax=Desmophyllum pertusum TaxID=174260 RepID=A0A9X0A250_9CNID|nr:hypothetical protein OS493_018475 [Desmophyllum pertusum]